VKKFLICKTCLVVFATLVLVGCSTTTYRDVINNTEKRSIESGYIGKGEPKTCGVLVKVADLHKFRTYVNNPRPMDRFPLYDRTSGSSYTICWTNNQRGLTAAYEACQKWFDAECALIFQRPEKTTGVYNLLPSAMSKYDNYLNQLAAKREQEKMPVTPQVSSKSRLAIYVDLTNLTNSVMNGWRADYKRQMGSLLQGTGCSASVDLTNLTDSVMNGWRADYKRQMTSLLSCTGCSASVDLTNLTDSVMNGWRADYKRQMSSLLSCVNN
jgi:hypothetical protein